MKNLSGTSFDHRLESLEGRSLLSAGASDAAAAPAPAHEVVAIVADAGFLNAASDASDPKGHAQTTGDAEMYDFGGAWGTQAAGQQVQAPIDLGGGAVDQDPGGSMPRTAPSDLSTVVQADFGHAAPYNGAVPVITYNTDPVMVDGPAIDAPVDAPVNAPVVNAPMAEVAAPVQPAAPIAVVPPVSVSVTAMEWIEIPGMKSKTVPGSTIVDQVVIASTFVSH